MKDTRIVLWSERDVRCDINEDEMNLSGTETDSKNGWVNRDYGVACEVSKLDPVMRISSLKW